MYFDITISRSGAMFFGDAPAAFTNIARALRPGGRLVQLAWQPLQRNDWISGFVTALAADHQTDRSVFYDSAAWLIEARRS